MNECVDNGRKKRGNDRERVSERIKQHASKGVIEGMNEKTLE